MIRCVNQTKLPYMQSALSEGAAMLTTAELWCRVAIVLVAPFLTASSHADHMLLMWEHKDYHGHTGYILLRNHNCKPLIPQWRNKVSSVNTYRHCYQLFTGEACDGKEVFVYPMSKNHHDMKALGINDAIKSIRLCVLDEGSVDKSASPFNPNGAEYQFWTYIFEKLSASHLQNFEMRTSTAKFIDWDFLPNVYNNVSTAEQYQYALDWLLDEIANRHMFKLPQLKSMRKMAYSVFDFRANQNAVREPRPPLGSRADAILFQLEVYWKMVVEVIDNEVERIEFGSEEVKRPKFEKRRHR